MRWGGKGGRAFYISCLHVFPGLHPCYHWHESLQCNDIRKTNRNLIVIGKTKTITNNDKEEFDNDAVDDDADNVLESEGEEFEQETG